MTSHERWPAIVELLLGSRLDPESLLNEGTQPPEAAGIGHALRACDTWQCAGGVLPDRIPPGSAGGIAFELYRVPCFSDFEYQSNGEATWRIYRDSRQVERRRFRWKPQSVDP